MGKWGWGIGVVKYCSNRHTWDITIENEAHLLTIEAIARAIMGDILS
jgi:hypothetical protein